MITKDLKSIYLKELEQLRSNIEQYKREDKLWVTDNNIPNSGGNLCLHLVGNLKTYIGNEIGKIAYTRNREQEFSLKDIPKQELLRMVDETIAIIGTTFDLLSEEQLSEEYPLLVWPEKTSVFYLLTRILSHLSYHTGQINYHRRMLDVWEAISKSDHVIRTLIAAMNMTLDGYCDHAAMTADDEIHQHYNELLRDAGLLKGRIDLKLIKTKTFDCGADFLLWAYKKMSGSIFDVFSQ